MDQLRKIVGMSWTTPIVRTAVQSAAVILVGSGLNWLNTDVWKMALLSAGAAVFAKLQELSRP